MKCIIAIVAVLGLMASPALAIDLDFGLDVGAGAGVTENWSGTAGFAGSAEFGAGVKSKASFDGYGMSESNLKGTFKNGQASFRGGITAASGSMSTATISSKGTGFGAAAAGGAGFGGGYAIGGTGGLKLSN